MDNAGRITDGWKGFTRNRRYKMVINQDEPRSLDHPVFSDEIHDLHGVHNGCKVVDPLLSLFKYTHAITRGGILFVRKLIMTITSQFPFSQIHPVMVRLIGGHLAFYTNTSHNTSISGQASQGCVG